MQAEFHRLRPWIPQCCYKATYVLYTCPSPFSSSVVQFSAVSYDYPAFSVYLTQYLTEHAEADIFKKSETIQPAASPVANRLACPLCVRWNVTPLDRHLQFSLRSRLTAVGSNGHIPKKKKPPPIQSSPFYSLLFSSPAGVPSPLSVISPEEVRSRSNRKACL